MSSSNITVETIVVMSIVGVSTSIGLLLYMLILPALVYVLKTTKQTFYILIISLAIPDILWLLSTLIYSIPTVIVGVYVFGELTEKIMGYFDTVVYFMQLTHLFFISINRLRFVSRSSTETFDKVFTTPKLLTWCAILWIFSIGNGILLPATSCVKSFSHYYWSMTCDNSTAANVGQAINGGLSNFFPVASCAIYLIMWAIIRFKKSKIADSRQNSWRKNLNLVIQFSLVTLFMIGESSAYWILPRFVNGTTMSAVAHVLAVACASVNPYIYLIFNEGVRNYVKTTFGFKSNATVVDTSSGGFIRRNTVIKTSSINTAF